MQRLRRDGINRPFAFGDGWAHTTPSGGFRMTRPSRACSLGVNRLDVRILAEDFHPFNQLAPCAKQTGMLSGTARQPVCFIDQSCVDNAAVENFTE